jgi:hypothetical protein
MLAAAYALAYTGLLAEQLIDKQPPVPGLDDEVSMTTMIGGDPIAVYQILTDAHSNEFLSYTGMNGAIQPSTSESI